MVDQVTGNTNIGAPCDGGVCGAKLASLDLALAFLVANANMLDSIGDSVNALADEIRTLLQADPESAEVDAKFKAILDMMIAKITEQFVANFNANEILEGSPNDGALDSINSKIQALNSAIAADPTSGDIIDMLSSLNNTINNTDFILRSEKLADLDSMFNTLKGDVQSASRNTYSALRQKLTSAKTIDDVDSLIDSLKNYAHVETQSNNIKHERENIAFATSIAMKVRMHEASNKYKELQTELNAYEKQENLEKDDDVKRVRTEGKVTNMNKTTDEYYDDLKIAQDKIKSEKQADNMKSGAIDE